MSYILRGSQDAAKFFVVGEASGEVKLKTSLLQDSKAADSYTVCNCGHCTLNTFSHTLLASFALITFIQTIIKIIK